MPELTEDSVNIGPSSQQTEPTPPFVPPHVSADQTRARFLRACDRCRLRKVKCDEKDPCERCAKSGMHCTFDGDPKLLASSHTKSRKRRRTPTQQPPTSDSSRRKTSASRSSDHREEDNVAQANRESPWTAHFFIGQDGTPRMLGHSSGLPIIDALQRATSTLKRNEGDHNDQDWGSLSRLLMGDADSDAAPTNGAGMLGNNEEFFPDRQPVQSPVTTVDLLATVSALIPPDLLAALVQLFVRYDVIHPSWPIVHPTSFFEDLYRWTDPGCTALVVAMCMLASRYTTDRRVLASPSDPTSAGLQYHELFRRLANFEQGSGLYHLIAHFFAAQYFCTDNVPRPLGYTYFGIALSRAVDAGLHRGIPSNVPITAVERESRKRTAWALFCWDKQIAALFGRLPFIRLVQIDVDIPEVYPDADENSSMACMALDKKYVEIFRAFTSVSAILDFTLNQVVHNPVYPNWDFVTKVSEAWEKSGEEGLARAESLLRDWQRLSDRQLTPALSSREGHKRTSSPLYSIASEQVAATETFVYLMTAARRLFLATINGPGMEEGDTRAHSREIGQRLRTPIILHARNIIQSCIQLGAAGRLKHADILVVYRVLAAGRLLVACALSARTDDDRTHGLESRQAAQAASIVLHRLVVLFPIALGAAETLDETCRVCGVNIDTSSSMHHSSQKSVWYRPLRQRPMRQVDGTLQSGVHDDSLAQGAHDPPGRTQVDDLFGDLNAALGNQNAFWSYETDGLDSDLQNGGLSFIDTELPPEGMELNWLLSHAGQSRM